jgi:Ca2+-binding RTX toxin-like protein
MTGAGMRKSLSQFTPMSLTVLLACTAAMAVALMSAAVASQAQEIPSCFGVPATIVGTEGDDVIDGTTQADVIVGLGGSDFIKGRAGGDRICGGPNPEPNPPEVWPEQLFGDRGNDRISGGDGMDDIHGNNSNGFLADPWGEGVHDDDILKGGAGFDTLVDKRSGDVDKLYGGSTDDRLYGGDGDFLDFLDAGAQDYSVFNEPDRRGDFCNGDQATDGTAQDMVVNCEWGGWISR